MIDVCGIAGLTGSSAAVLTGRLVARPPTLPEFLALPREVFHCGGGRRPVRLARRLTALRPKEATP